MRTSATLSVCGLGVGGVALAVMAVLSAACASGGNAPPVTGAEAEALFADLTGVWVLDESGSSPQLPDLPPELQRFEFTKGSARANRESAAMAGSLANLHNTYLVLRLRPDTLVLRANEVELVYMPSPGQEIAVPMNGKSVLGDRVGRRRVRTGAFWEEKTLGLWHRVDSRGEVREMLEIVGSRLRMTRAVHGVNDVPPVVVLMYDRKGGGD